MITVLTGENNFEVRQALAELSDSYTAGVERVDGASLTLAHIPDLLMGVSLFAENRLVIIDQLSASSAVWAKLPEWLSRVSDTIHLVLIEPSLDKRTSTYKALKVGADIKEFPAWTEKDGARVQAWAVHYAADQGLTLSRPVAAHLVSKVGVDQWRLSQAIAVLALLEEGTEITPVLIDATIVPSTEESAFQLLEAAFGGRAEEVARMVQSLALSEDPHRLMALIVSQVFSLAATVLAPEGADPAKDFGVHPFVISKLRRFKSSLGTPGALAMVELCAQADVDLKSSKAEPWVLVERLLVRIAHKDF
ncbi:DNA polymerase III subunit delta [Candidatus Saccharibacteria bacterium TM7i]|nr:DNA polymerase III subunit delta [Candidatus Saccharibacteria bacterium TM7i]